eukprot:gene45799-61216_t
MDENKGPFRFHLRPGLHEFLNEVSKFSEMYVLTAAVSYYARPAIKAIDANGKFFKEVFSREQFNYLQGKDIRILGADYDEKRTVLVDNMLGNFNIQPYNGILVKDFYCDPHDRQLESLLTLLQHLKDEHDVRRFLGPRY